MSTNTTIAQENAKNMQMIRMITSKIAQSLLIVQQHDLLSQSQETEVGTVAQILAIEEPMVPTPPNDFDTVSAANTTTATPMVPTPPNDFDTVSAANTTTATPLVVIGQAVNENDVNAELSISEQLLLLFRTERGKLKGHSHVFNEVFAFEQVMVIGGALAELILLRRIKITKKVTTGWFGSTSTDAVITLISQAPTGKPALDELVSNINLETLLKKGQLLLNDTPPERSVSVQKFLRKYFVGRNFGYDITGSMLTKMQERNIIKERTIHCGLFWMWKRKKFIDTKDTANILQQMKLNLRNVVLKNQNHQSSSSSLVALRFFCDAVYLTKSFQYLNYNLLNKSRGYLNKLFTNDEMATTHFSQALGTSLNVPLFSTIMWNKKHAFQNHLQYIAVREATLWSQIDTISMINVVADDEKHVNVELGVR